MLIALLLHLLIINAQQASAAQPAGFLNIDCGGTGQYFDEYGASWVPDDQYITTGNTASVSEVYFSRPKYYHRVRYFPDSSRKHCYALPVGFNQTYLIRPWFLHGDYDKTNSTAEVHFDIIVAADTFEHVKVWDTFYEFIVKSDNTTLDFCLASNDSATAPFISAIEMRPLDTGMYSLSNSRQGLSMPWGGRINFGVNIANQKNDKIRFPEDKFDRTWLNDTYLGFLKTRNYSPLSQSVSPEIIVQDQPPPAVMSTGLTSSADGTIILEFPNITITERSCYFNFYFAFNFHQLHGTIPKEIQNLVHLTKIFLDNNTLEGELPDFSSLKNLTTLHLQNNKLTGAVPASLQSIQDLSIQNNNFDCISPGLQAPSFNGTIPPCKHSNKKKILGGVIHGDPKIFRYM